MPSIQKGYYYSDSLNILFDEISSLSPVQFQIVCCSHSFVLFRFYSLHSQKMNMMGNKRTRKLINSSPFSMQDISFFHHRILFFFHSFFFNIYIFKLYCIKEKEMYAIRSVFGIWSGSREHVRVSRRTNGTKT